MFVFSDYCRRSTAGFSVLLTVLFYPFLQVQVHADNPLPIGIPAPPFGLQETHLQYAGRSGYLDAGNGPYTHYVDNTDRDCSNSGPGTEARPLCRLPLNVSAGAVIEVHGGPYTNSEYPQKERKLNLQGSASKPIFVRGVADPRGDFPMFKDTAFFAYGKYFVLENLVLDGTNIYVGQGNHVNHVALRNMEVRNHPQNNAVNLFGTEMVVANSHIHHNYGDDRHGVYVSDHSRNVWVLDNRVHHNSGDGIQFCHNCKSDPPEFIYIGGNDFYSNRENGVDLKYARHVVVSQNRIYNHIEAPKKKYWCFDDNSYCGVFSSGSDGSSIVVGSDGGPEDVVIIFNDIYDSANGIRIEEGRDIVVAGNQMHRIDRNGLILEKVGKSVYFSNNTLHNMDTGVRHKSGADFEIEIRNNIFSKIDHMIEFSDNKLADNTALDNNLFWDAGSNMSFRWVDPVKATTGADFDRLRGKVKQGNRVGDPRFRNPAGADFSLREGSEALNNAATDLIALDQRYRSEYRDSPSILKGFTGASRVGCDIDIGAYESECGGNGSSDDGGNSGNDNPDDGNDSGNDNPDDGNDSGNDIPDDGDDSGGDSSGDDTGGGGTSLPHTLEARRTYEPTVSIDASVELKAEQPITVVKLIEMVAGYPGDNWARLYLEGDEGAITCLYQGNGWKRKTDAPCNQNNGDAYRFSYCVDQASYERYSCSKSPDKNKCTAAAVNVSALDKVNARFIELGVLEGDRCGDTEVRVGL